MFDLAATSVEVPEPGSEASPSGGSTTDGEAPVAEGGPVTIAYECPNGTTDKRVVTYFEEWGDLWP